MTRLATAADEIEGIVHATVSAAARDGASLIYAGDAVKQILRQHPNLKVSPTALADAVIREAVAKGVAVKIDGESAPAVGSATP